MRREAMIAFAILGLAGCGQQKNQGASSASSASSEAAKPDVAAPANPDAASCLDLVANEMYSDAIAPCERALGADAANEKVKSALATARAKIAETATKAA